MIVPSDRLLTSIPVIDQVPPEIVVVWAVVEFVPSLTTTETVAPSSPVPLIDALLSLERFTGLVTAVIATVVLVDVALTLTELPDVSVAVAANVIVPSLSAVTSMPVIDQVPSPATVVVWAAVEWVPSLATREIVAPGSPVPLAVTSASLAMSIGLVTDVMVAALFEAVWVPVAVLPAASVSVAV